jgi:alpha-tubulin suppressor-like RCC1 family protein
VSGAPAGDFLQVSAGFSHACAVATDNDVECWGLDAYGKATPPAGVKMSAVSAGHSHACGIDLAGVLHCWGRNNVGQTDAPLGSYVSVSCGDDHSCAIDGADAMRCWGIYTDDGELNAAREGTWASVSVWSHSCAVDLAGVVTCWGEDTYDETLAPDVWW